MAANALAPAHPIAGALLAAQQAAPQHPNPLIHLLLSFGLLGVFLVSVVDSSFVPLPIPGITDILVIVLAAQHANPFLLVAAATAGSFLGGLFSYHVGQSGGMAFLEKYVPHRIFKHVCNWMETHAILSVALPAVLPPPMPLSPFVLAAGALNMSRRKFLTTFTLSRLARHSIAAAVGIYYGPHVVRMWNLFTRKWGVEILVAIWTVILLIVAIAFWKIYNTSRTLDAQPSTQPQTDPTPTQV
ncbi:MAG: VTT domain-containing protein [Acidobacteriaceae bacterium]|jgi:membrane protein YqaA with SNARE-associated domain